jgi:hypothetical protein
MGLADFKSKYKVSKLYAYKEERVPAENNITNIYFGWSDTDVLDLSQDVVLSTASKSKKTTEEERAWSKEEGVTAANLSDYRSYFFAAANMSPEEFVAKWSSSKEELESAMKALNPSYKDEEGDFALKLARLLSFGEKFSKFGRVYKVISTND